MRHLLWLALAGTLITACGNKREVGEAPAWKTPEGRSEVRLRLAEAMVDFDQTQEAQVLLAQMREDGQKGPELDLLQGRALHQQGMTSEAEPLLLHAKKKMPKDPRPSIALGLLYADTNRPELAIGAFREALERDDENAGAWNNLGYMLFVNKETGDAVDALRKAVSLDGSQPRYRMNLGYALFADGQADAAYKTFESVGTEADAHYNLGHAYELKGDWQAAHMQYNLALKASPGHEQAFEGLKRLETPQEEP